jgi:hypothetical protein
MAELVSSADVTIDEINARGAEVSKLVSSKAFVPALLKALEKPPLLTKDAKIKEANRDIVFKVLENITADAQISTFCMPSFHSLFALCVALLHPNGDRSLLREVVFWAAFGNRILRKDILF